MGAVFGFVEMRQFGAGNPRQHAIHGFENGDLLAEFRQHGGGFQPDVTAADDGDARGSAQFALQRLHIGAGADGMDAGKIMAVATQPARLPPVAQINSP